MNALRTLLLLFTVLAGTLALQAAEPCTTIHGRAHLYGGDGQLRIWHIGTHHDFEPDDASWPRVVGWLNAGVKDPMKRNWAIPASSVDLFADFLVCPVEPYKKGSVQRAAIKSAEHRHYGEVE